MAEINWKGFKVPMKWEEAYLIERGSYVFELRVFRALEQPGESYFCYVYEAPRRRSPVLSTDRIEPSELTGWHCIAMSHMHSTREEAVGEMLARLQHCYPEGVPERVKIQQRA